MARYSRMCIAGRYDWYRCPCCTVSWRKAMSHQVRRTAWVLSGYHCRDGRQAHTDYNKHHGAIYSCMSDTVIRWKRYLTPECNGPARLSLHSTIDKRPSINPRLATGRRPVNFHRGPTNLTINTARVFCSCLRVRSKQQRRSKGGKQQQQESTA